MSTIEEVIEKFRREPEGRGPLHLMSSDGGPALPGEIEKYWPALASTSEVVALWTVCRRAHLFENTEGRAPTLVLFDPRTSVETTAREMQRLSTSFRVDDVVIGRFIGGDAELVVFAPSESGERRILLVKETAVDREKWVASGSGVVEFLDEFFRSGGYRKRKR
jgi:hypothetical protein